MDKWQTLIGAFLGGVFALCAALIVAKSARRREEVAAAMLVISNLAEFKAAGANLRELSQEENIPEEHVNIWASEKLLWAKPKLSPLFEASLIQLMPIHPVLAAHLSLMKHVYESLDDNFSRLEKDFDIARNEKTNENPRPNEHILVEAKLIYKGFTLAEKHATCAEAMLTNFVLSNYPTWHRLRWRLFPNKQEKECMKLIREGHI